MTVASLFFINSVKILAGAEIWMLDAARGLREREIETRFITAPDSPLANAARQEGFPISEIPIRFDSAPWTIIKILKTLQDTPPSAVICNHLKDLKTGGFAARLARVERIYLTRESDFPLRRRFYYRFYLQRIATGILVNSRATLETTRRSAPWLSPTKLHLLYKGVDTERFHPLAGKSPGITIGFAGQLIERKGLRALMAAWRLVETAGEPRLRLHLAGEGPLHTDLIAWRESLRYPENVLILGQLDEMPTFYHNLDILVLPSLQEGFGLVVVEAAACGLPVIATRTSSLPELVQHQRTGMLIEPDNIPDLAATILDLATDPERAAAMGKAGRDFVHTHFSRSAMLDGLVKLIQPCNGDRS